MFLGRWGWLCCCPCCWSRRPQRNRLTQLPSPPRWPVATVSDAGRRLGHSWLHGWPGYAQAVSDIQYFGFYPQMGWFVTNWLELYGEGTAHVYYRPHAAILGGVVGIGGRHYFLRDRQWTPYYTLAGGMAWTSLEVPEVDRIWNFQVVWGAGIKRITRRGRG